MAINVQNTNHHREFFFSSLQIQLKSSIQLRDDQQIKGTKKLKEIK